jgi:TolA-binding protein
LDDAAEYARQAQLLTPPKDLVAALACLRGESLARRGRPAEAALEFDAVANAQADSPYLAQALAGSAETHAAAGDPAAAAASRARLFKEFPDTPWADRLRSPQP